jgi:hypothetical protein
MGHSGWRLKVPFTTKLELLPIASRPQLASLEMGPLVALRDVLTDIVEGCLGCGESRAWCLTDRGWFLILLCHVLHSSTLR